MGLFLTQKKIIWMNKVMDYNLTFFTNFDCFLFSSDSKYLLNILSSTKKNAAPSQQMYFFWDIDDNINCDGISVFSMGNAQLS